MGFIMKKNINKIYIGKAGKNRGLGYRSKVRGVAKNPCDHPHGGGNGKKSKLVNPVNAWCTVFK
jgi:large subunit ribosomal protein L2